MIAFACSGCGKSLQVKDEFAGRKSKCPKCTRPLVVPSVSKAVRTAPKDEAPQELATTGRAYHEDEAQESLTPNSYPLMQRILAQVVLKQRVRAGCDFIGLGPSSTERFICVLMFSAIIFFCVLVPALLLGAGPSIGILISAIAFFVTLITCATLALSGTDEELAARRAQIIGDLPKARELWASARAAMPTAKVKDLFVVPTATVPTAPAEPRFYYMKKDQRFGPLPLKMMEKLVISLQLLPDDLVWPEGAPQWVPARQIPDLFAKAPAVSSEATPIVRPVDEETLDVVLVKEEIPAVDEEVLEVLPADSSIPGVHNCSDCMYRLARHICGHNSSTYFRQRIELTHVCPCFEASPALRDLLDFKLRTLREQGSYSDRIELLVRAINASLPEDDEIWARLMLARAYFRLAVERATDGAFLEVPLFWEAYKQMEYAVTVDCERDYGVFQNSTNVMLLVTFDVGYTVFSDRIKERKGVNAAITFLEDKLSLFRSIPGDPLLYVLVALAAHYDNESVDDEKSACACLRRALRAPPIPGCEDDRERWRQMASKNLDIIQRRS